MRYRNLSTSCEPMHQREAPALRATGAFFIRSGKPYSLSSSTGTAPTSRPSSSTTATLRSASVGASRAISRAMVCALEMASSSSQQSRPAGSTSLWPFFTSKKYRDIFRTAFCSLLRARPRLFVAAQGWDRAGHATPRLLVQSPKLRSSNSSDAPGIGQQRERDGMQSQRPQMHSAGGN
jgi:hypothetical protein